MIPDDAPPEFHKVDFDRGGPTTFNTHIGNLYVKRGARGTRDEFVLGFRVQQNMCNPAGGLHGGDVAAEGHHARLGHRADSPSQQPTTVARLHLYA